MVKSKETIQNIPPQQLDNVDMAEIMGYETNQFFPDRAQELLAQELNPEQTQAIKDQLKTIDIDLDPRTLPGPISRTGGIRYFELLTEDDKTRIQDSQNPLLTIWGLTSLRYDQEDFRYSAKYSSYVRWFDKDEEEAARVALGSMGLVHGTSYEGLLAAINQGAFVPNREIADDTQGNTLHTDRDLGLDGYVFADFARPHMYRADDPPEVEVVFDLDAMSEPGSFATEDDIADTSLRGYMGTIAEADYFLERALLKIRGSRNATKPQDSDGNDERLSVWDFIRGDDSDRTSLGNPTFSTWEVKMPRVDTSKIKKIIFRDPELHQAFIDTYGEQYSTELVEPGGEATYYDEEELQANSVDVAQQRAAAFTERVTRELSLLPPEDKEIIAVALNISRDSGKIDTEEELAIGNTLQAEAATDPELQQIMRTYGSGTIRNLEGIIYDGYRGRREPIVDDKGDYLVVHVERARRNTELSRFLDIPEVKNINDEESNDLEEKPKVETETAE